MARDLRTAQRGMDVGQNDLTLEPGTPVYCVNCDFQRGYVSQRRVGFDRFDVGQPWDTFETDGNADGSHISPRGYRPKWGKFHELFSKTRLFQYMGGLLMAYDDVDPDNTGWMSVPVNLSAKLRILASYSDETYFSYGKMIIRCPGIATGQSFGWALWDGSTGAIGEKTYAHSGAIANTKAQAIYGAPGDTQQSKYRTAFDVVRLSGIAYVSDETSLRAFSSANGVSPNKSGEVIAGSITVQSAWDGSSHTLLGSRFFKLEWMVVYNGLIYAAENGTEIVSFDIGGNAVALVAGSVTAGTADGTTGASSTARFTSITGLCSDGAGRLYVRDQYAVRVVDLGNSRVRTIAGSITASGYTEGVGTTARFQNGSGIEFVGDPASASTAWLYTADAPNNAIRKLRFTAMPPTGTGDTVVSTYCGGQVFDDTIGGALSAVRPHLPVMRGTVVADNGEVFASVECINPAVGGQVSTECMLLHLSKSDGSNDQRDRGLFYARAPGDASVPDFSEGPNKLDSVGPNAYGNYQVRSSDVDFGAAFTGYERPRIIDEYTRITKTYAMPRLRQIGIEWPEAPSVTTVSGGSLMSGGYQAAYRVVYGLNLPTGKIALGPPSERVVVANTGATGSITDISIIPYPPPSLPWGEGNIFAQVYRTLISPSTTDPGDTMFLAIEVPITYGTTPSVTDVTIDSALGPALYTNDTERGVEATSFAPPRRVSDMAMFDSRLVMANYETAPSARLKVLGATATITLTVQSGGLTFISFTSGSSNDFNAHQFKRVTSGSAASNIDATTRNLVQCINRCPDAWMIRAVIDDSDLGAFVIYGWRDGIDFSIASTSTNLAITTTDNAPAKPNALAWSDPFVFDSFPAVNEQLYGSSIETIRRILPISDSLLMVKDQQIRRLDTSFADQQYDNSAAGALHDSFAQLNNQWLGLFDKGALSLTSSGALAIGKPIDRVLRSYLRPGVSGEKDADLLGASWTGYDTGSSSLSHIAFMNEMYTVFGDGSTISVSADAKSWSVSSNGAHALAFGADCYIASALGSGNLSRSADLVTWSVVSSGINNSARQIIFASGQFIAVGSAPTTGNGLCKTSPDGVSWTSVDAQFGSSQIEGIAYSNGTYVAVGRNGKISSSADGITWIARTSGVGSSLFGVKVLNGKFVAFGGSGVVCVSDDGATWSTGSTGLSTQMRDVTYGNGKYVVVGDAAAGVPQCAYSTNGTSWTTFVPGGSSAFKSVAFGRGVFALGDSSGTIYTSSDLSSFTAHGAAVSGDSAESIIYNDGRFVAAGGTHAAISGNGSPEDAISCFGAANEQTGKYLFSLVAPLANTVKTFSFDAVTSSWSEWVNSQYQTNDVDIEAFGLGVVGSFRGVFVSAVGNQLKQVRSVGMQRDWRRNPTGQWYEDFAEFSLSFVTVHSVSGSVIVLDYDSTINPFEQLPSADSLSGSWLVGQADQTIGLVASASIVNASLTLTMIDAHAATPFAKTPLRLLCPIVKRIDFGTVFPGVNSQFGPNMTISVERVMHGSLTVSFYNRKDRADPSHPFVSGYNGADPLYSSAIAVVARTYAMDNLFVSGLPLASMAESVRVAIPAERAVDQFLAVRFFEQKVGPLAIKATSVDVRPTDTTEVKQ